MICFFEIKSYSSFILLCKIFPSSLELKIFSFKKMKTWWESYKPLLHLKPYQFSSRFLRDRNCVKTNKFNFLLILLNQEQHAWTRQKRWFDPINSALFYFLLHFLLIFPSPQKINDSFILFAWVSIKKDKKFFFV